MITDVIIPPYGLALIAAFLFALGGQIQHIGLQSIDARAGTMLSIGSSAGIYWLAAPVMLNPEYFLHPAVLIFIGLGLIRPALSANLSVAAIRLIGPTLTTTLAATSPLFGTAFGILILGELLTWQVALGTLGIMAAVLILTRRDKRIPASWPLWALALPVGAAMIRSFGHGLTKIGMEYIPDPYFAGLVGFTVSLILTGTLHLMKKERKPLKQSKAGVYWFLLAGTMFGSAILALNTALLNGSIVTVVPIVAASPIFSMLLSVLVFRREHLNLRIVVAVFVVMPSVVLIALGK